MLFLAASEGIGFFIRRFSRETPVGHQVRSLLPIHPAQLRFFPVKRYPAYFIVSPLFLSFVGVLSSFIWGLIFTLLGLV